MSASKILFPVLAALLTTQCKDNMVGPSQSTTRGANGVPAGADSKVSTTPTPSAAGDQLDPQFSSNLAELALMMGLSPAQIEALRHTLEQRPELLAQMRAAVVQLAEANKDLLEKIAKEFVPLADAQILIAKIQYLTG